MTFVVCQACGSANPWTTPRCNDCASRLCHGNGPVEHFLRACWCLRQANCDLGELERDLRLARERPAGTPDEESARAGIEMLLEAIGLANPQTLGQALDILEPMRRRLAGSPVEY